MHASDDIEIITEKDEDVPVHINYDFNKENPSTVVKEDDEVTKDRVFKSFLRNVGNSKRRNSK